MTVRIIEGDIDRLRCADGAEYFHFTPSGDSDVQTEMIGSLSTLMGPEVIVAEMSTTEWDAYESDGTIRFEERISRLLSRDDLKYLQLVRSVCNSPFEPVASFQEFRKSSKPPTYYYASIDGDLESMAIEVLSPSEFEAIGGTITIVGDLAIVENE